MDISVIIVNWNTKDLLLNCLNSVFETVEGISFEIWLVDNGSIDGSVEAVIRAYPDVNVIKNKENLGFAAANNRAFKKMKGRYALLLNTDATLTEGAVRELYSFMETNQEAGLACGQLLNQDGSRQNSIANFPSLLSLISNETFLRIMFPNKFPSKREEYNSPIEIDSCIGACMIARKKAIDQVGLFDEQYFFFFEETDWAYSMKQSGWRVYFVPKARIFHAQGRSVGNSANSRIMFYRSRYLYFKKWHLKTYPLIYSAILVRLLVNTFLCIVGILFTLGFRNDLNKKLAIYLQLIGWHLMGCPKDNKKVV